MKKEKQSGQKNKFIFPGMGFFVLTVLAITIILLITAVQWYLNDFREVQDNKKFSGYYAMIVEDRAESFWQEVYQGAYEAGLKEDIYVELLGENLSQEYTIQELMEIAVYSEVDGIIVQADESDEMTKLINQAVDAGIPVITLYEDNTKSERCCYVSIGNYDLGREYGRQIMNLSAQGARNVLVVVSGYASDFKQNLIWTGIQETIEKENQGHPPIELSLMSVDDSNDFVVEEYIREIFMKEELPDTIVCLNELNTTCVYQAVIDYNQVGNINILGYYDSETILKGIEREVINATVAVDTEQMGKASVNALTEYRELGYTSDYFIADITLIDKENVADFCGGDADETE